MRLPPAPLLLLVALFAAAAGAGITDDGRHLAFVTTYCGGRTSVAAIHVLAESLLRAGHREGLSILVSDGTPDDELQQLRAAPLAALVPAPPASSYCDGDPYPDPCAHLPLTAFDPTLPMGAPIGSNVVLLAPDRVVVGRLDALRTAAAFSAVQAEHGDAFTYGTLVLRRDAAVARALRDAACQRSLGAADVLDTAVPAKIWTALDDAYSVPADHLDTAWYRQSGAVPLVVSFVNAPKPWSWWRDDMDVHMSMHANAHWCEAAAFTPYSCGWGGGSPDDVVQEVVVKEEPNSVPPPLPAVPQTAPFEPGGSSTAPKFTVLLSTYSRQTYKALVRHYNFMKCVGRVVLLWHDPKADAPSGSALGNNVVVIRATRDSLNNRFAVPAGFYLPEAVYVCDDDMMVPEKAMVHAYGVWRAHTRRLVGLFPRRWAKDGVRYSAKIHNGYNIVLTKGVFVHRSFLYMYHWLLPKTVRDVVDDANNCEDILLNIVVSRYTRQPPVHVMVEDTILDLGHHGGISKRGAHFKARNNCVTDIARALGIEDWSPPLARGSMSVRPLKNREI